MPTPIRIEENITDRLRGVHVLIVDDNQDLCRSIGMFLEGHEMQVDTVFHAGRAREMIKNGNHDLIILDIMMQDVDGFELFEYLRKDIGNDRTPVLFLSALVEPRHSSALNEGEPGRARVLSKSDISQRLLPEILGLLE